MIYLIKILKKMKNNDFYIKGNMKPIHKIPQINNIVYNAVFTCDNKPVVVITITKDLFYSCVMTVINKTFLKAWDFDIIRSIIKCFDNSEMYGISKGNQLSWVDTYDKIKRLHNGDAKVAEQVFLAKFIFHFIRYLGYRKELNCIIAGTDYNPKCYTLTNKDEFIC